MFFPVPSGPEQYARLMQLLPVYELHKLGKDNLWATILLKFVAQQSAATDRHSFHGCGILDQQNI